MVNVEAVVTFSTMLPNGEFVAAVPGELVMLPKDRADELMRVGFVKTPTARAPETKAPAGRGRSHKTASAEGETDV